MVARATMPSSITTQEQFVVWAIQALDIAVPTQAVLERPNLTSFNCEWQQIKAPDGVLYFVGRVVIPMAKIDTLPAGSKAWLAALNIPQAGVIPAYYSAN